MALRNFSALLLLLLIWACQSDQTPKKTESNARVAPNSIAWELNGESMQLNRVGGSFGATVNGNNLVIFSTDGKQGLVLNVMVDSTSGYIGKHPFVGRRVQPEVEVKDCWARYNKKVEGNDISFVSKFCKPTDGFIEITFFDDKKRLVSGTFQGTLCPAGTNAEGIDPVRIEKGVFQKLNIARLQ